MQSIFSPNGSASRAVIELTAASLYGTCPLCQPAPGTALLGLHQLKKRSQLAALQAAILSDAADVPKPGARVLDLGCGNGDVVQGWLDLGYDAYGCDFKFKPGPLVEPLQQSGRLSAIDQEPYRLPFPDNSFDLLVTQQVLEHVRDYPTTLAETKRVLKPGGHALHMFPARLMPIEPHTRVPGATVFRSPSWLRVWAKLGVRSPGQVGMPWQDVACRNQTYLERNTNYLTGPELRRHFTAYFDHVQFVEDSFLKNSPNRRGRILAQLGRIAPPLFSLYRSLWARVVLARA
jgi:SAM-dependent methyltransferase